MSETYLTESMLIKALKLILKIILFLLLLILFVVIGLFVGYCLIGDGNYWEVLNRDTWQHIINFVK
ncbi:DNA-directed RNA polymerase subunit beta [Globicatella sanguinis]